MSVSDFEFFDQTEGVGVVGDGKAGLRTGGPGSQRSWMEVFGNLDLSEEGTGELTASTSPFIIQLQAVLSEVKSEAFCRAFLGGEILQMGDLDRVLKGLQELSETIFPGWGALIHNKKLGSEVAGLQMEMLVKGSDCKFTCNRMDLQGDSHSYREWKVLIKAIISSRFWDGRGGKEVIYGTEKSRKLDLGKMDKLRSVRATDRMDGTTSGSLPSRGAFGGQSWEKDREIGGMERRKFKSGEWGGIDWDQERRRHHRKAGKKGMGGFESSDSDSCSDSDSSDASVDYRKSKKRHWREVVVPPVFDLEGPVSLSKYLKGYEWYFQSKYAGNQRECSQELSRFISGELKEVYEVVGGHHSRYWDIKPKLLEWYRSQRMSQDKQYQQSLRKVAHKQGESIKLYCMRLEEMVSRAYPGDPKRQSKEARQKVMETAPTSFVKQIDKKKELKRMLRMGKSVSWSEIMEIAEEFDKQQKRAVRTRGDDLDARLNKLYVAAVQGGDDDQPSRGMQRAPAVKTGGVNDEGCSFCHNPNHVMEDCWRRLGRCLLCGSDKHLFKDCPRHRANRGGARGGLAGGAVSSRGPLN